MPDRLSVFDLVEAFHLSTAAATLHDQGLLAALTKPTTAEELAAIFGFEVNLLRGVLDYLAARTGLVRKVGQRFVAGADYSPGCRFLLDHYIGAYGPNANRLSELLRRPSMAQGLVDRARHARAFSAVGAAALGALPQIIERLELNYLLDLGCGPGTLLLELAQRNAGFFGWGIDLNHAMCRAARHRVSEDRLEDRLRFLRGDCTKLQRVLPRKLRAAVQTISACNLVNEMFAGGSDRVIKWLRDLRQLLPGRLLLIADYYGRLGVRNRQLPRMTALHDYVQLISGQGIPPPDVATWRKIHSRAGSKLVHVLEDKTTTRFVHFVQL